MIFTKWCIYMKYSQVALSVKIHSNTNFCMKVISCCFFFCIKMRTFSTITRAADTVIPVNNMENGPNSTSPPRGPTDSLRSAGPCQLQSKHSFGGKSWVFKSKVLFKTVLSGELYYELLCQRFLCMK